MSKFDYSRPLYKKVLVRAATRTEQASGVKELPIMEVGMYLDEPGVFYDNQGQPVDEKTATQPGGFTKEQVGRFKRLAERNKQIDAIKAKFEAEIAEAAGEEAGAEKPKGSASLTL